MLRIVFLLVFFLLSGANGQCVPNVFVLPLFHDHDACNTTAYKQKCDQLFVDFVAGCADSALKPQEISILFSPFDVPTECKTSATECEGMAEKTGDLAIPPHSSTDLLKSFAHFQLPTTRLCLDNSVAVILTDIPCSSYEDYPNVNRLLGNDHLLETITTFNTQFQFRTVIAYLSPNTSDPKTEACTNLRQHKFSPGADFIEFQFLNYEQLDGKICNKPFLQPINITRMPPPAHKQWEVVLLIAVLVLACGLSVCCGAGLIYSFYKECKKRRNFS